MKKGLRITATLFFLLVNTTYYWESKLGIWAIPAFFILVLVFLLLSVGLLRQFILAFREKFLNRYRLLTIGLLTTVLCLTFFYPSGLIDFDKLSGDDLLVAQWEGPANCRTTLKLKENGKFVERNVCFGLTEISGKYKVVNDTIYFENIDAGRNKDTYYRYALIRPSKFNKDNKHFYLVRFRDRQDTMEHELWIIKNDLLNK
jgi:hypothetical protein